MGVPVSASPLSGLSVPGFEAAEYPGLKTGREMWLSVVSPVYGCKGCLEELVDGIAMAVGPAGHSYEVILVDDNSPDSAWPRIVELAQTRHWLRGIRLSRNFGQHYAIAAGIEQARGDTVVVMDCDLQDPPEEIPKLVARLHEGFDVVFAQRTDRQDSWLKRFTSWAFFRLLSWLTGVQQDHTTANFGAYSRKVIDVINAMPERDRCFPLMVKWTGFTATNVPVSHAARQNGQSGYSFRKLVRLATEIVLSYSDKPLRLVVRVGLSFAAIAFAMVAWTLFRFFEGDTQVAGFTSVIASIWLVGGVIISCLGILGLYLGRLFVDAKRRPYYLISEQTRTEEMQDGN
jgi:glycosyltransferase involved in cell wall biosynthesis